MDKILTAEELGSLLDDPKTSRWQFEKIARANKLMLDNFELEPYEKDWQFIRDMLEEELEFGLTLDQVKSIFRLYPHARIKLAMHGTDNSAIEAAVDAVTHFLVNGLWPKWGEMQHEGPAEDQEAPVSGYKLRDRLKQQAIQMGLIDG